MTAPVALVGAGPGDADLLTLRAEGLLLLAAAVVTDGGVVALAEGFATRADVVAVSDGLPAVDELLAAVARTRGPVVRLYRGDPWLHPAYGVERERLEAAGVAVEAVSGVAVEVAVLALAGVPLHVRHLAVACTIGTARALPPASDPARTMVASGEDPAALVRAMASGDPELPAALFAVDDPASAWRGPLAVAGEPAATMTGPALLVTGAVCGSAKVPPGLRVSRDGRDPGEESSSAGRRATPWRSTAAGRPTGPATPASTGSGNEPSDAEVAEDRHAAAFGAGTGGSPPRAGGGHRGRRGAPPPGGRGG